MHYREQKSQLFLRNRYRNDKKLLEVVDLDIYGSIDLASFGNKQYFLTFMDYYRNFLICFNKIYFLFFKDLNS